MQWHVSIIHDVDNCFPNRNAHLTFDNFHIMKVINDAVVKVCRYEQKDRPELIRARYIWLKNHENLWEGQGFYSLEAAMSLKSFLEEYFQLRKNNPY